MSAKISKYTSIVLWIIAAVIIMSMMQGCASQEAYTGYLDTHKASSTGYYEAAKIPLVDITLPSPDPKQPYHIKLARDVKPMEPSQIKNSEWTGPLNGLIQTARMVGGIWAAGEAIGKITDNAGGNVTGNTTNSTTNSGDGTLTTAPEADAIDSSASEIDATTATDAYWNGTEWAE